MESRPHAVIVAGPNGAGKSTLAPRLLAEVFGISLYVNADVIAQGLAGFDPARVRARVALGGHDIPEADVRRRFFRSVANFEHLYRRTTDFWRVYHAVTPPADPEPRPIAHGEGERVTDIVDAEAWNALQGQVRQESRRERG